MKIQRTIRLMAISLALVLGSATLQSCGLLEIFAEAIGNICERPLVVSTTVDKQDDACLPEDCSLREAVVQANRCEGRQTIQIPAGTYTLSLTGRNENDAETGDLNILDPVTIEATGGRAIIDGGGIDRVFRISVPSYDEPEPVIMSNLTIQGGEADDHGGGVMVTGFTFITMNDVIVRTNSAGVAGSSGGTGGGIHLRGELTANNLTVHNNTVYGQGGGLYVDRGGSIVSGSTIDIEGNQSLDNYGGGGIYNRGVVSFSGLISGNSSDWTGGGAHNAGTMELTGVEILDNSAVGAGGGVANTNQLLFREVTVSGNEAPMGGGLFTYSAAAETVRSRLVDSSFEENTASESGGGIFNSAAALLIATRSDLYRNGAPAGGGIYNLGEATFLEANIGGNTAGEGQGGGVYNEGIINLTRTTLASNRQITPESRIGAAAIWTSDGGHVRMVNSTISGHSYTSFVGGVITNIFGTMTANHVTISANDGPIFGGENSSIASIEFQNSVLAGNPSITSCGGPITSLGGNVFDMTSCGATADDVVVSSGAAGLDALAMNGGRTMTHALQPDSPAVDIALSEACESTDQRGVPRPAGVACDAGAYEAEDIMPMSGELPEGIPVGPTTCRFGPRPIYPPVSYLDAGQTVQLLSRNEAATWVEVESLDGQVGPCWVDVDLLEVPELVDVMELDEGYIPPEPTLTPTPDSDEPSGGDSRPPCLLPDPNSPPSNVQYVCHASCPVPNDQAYGSCTP